jgi:tetratricopeptide (TPR) repeat protein
MCRFKFQVVGAIVFLIVAGLLLSGSALAFGSGKSDEEKAAENKQEAVKKYNEGLEHMQAAKATAAAGDSAFAYNYRATSDAKARKSFEKAASKFRDAVKRDPSLKEAFNNLGYSYRKLGKLEESLAAYGSALALDSNFAQAREYLGETYLALGKPDQAEVQRDWLAGRESPYADTLAIAIKLYQLQAINEKMNGK